MKKIVMMMMLACLTIGMSAQQQPEAKKWLKKATWSNGFKFGKPHKTVNADEFYRQYQLNQAQWDILFQWLRDTDLVNIPKGKHPIPNSTLVASVEDSENAPLEKRNTESHRKKADFQLVVKGTEGFALLDHATSTVKDPYNDKKDVMRYNYDKESTNFFDVKAGQFVIFFPSDWHIAKIQTKKKDQSIRVIVVKMDYIDK